MIDSPATNNTRFYLTKEERKYQIHDCQKCMLMSMWTFIFSQTIENENHEASSSGGCMCGEDLMY